MRPFIALAFALIPSAMLPAQQAPPLAGIAHVALRVKDLGASIDFYKSLGFDQAFDLRSDGVPYESFLKINDHQFLELYPLDPKNPQPTFLHLCFEGNDLDALHDDYIAHGLTPQEVRKASAGNLLFTMPGPNQPIGPDSRPIPQNIEYTQYMPGSLHSNDAGQHLGPNKGQERIGDRILGVGIAAIDPESARMFYINQLSFRPLPGQPMVLHLPGNSGEEVDIVPADLGRQALITFQTASLSHASRRLTHEHIKFQKAEDSLIFLDPDGNHILIRQR